VSSSSTAEESETGGNYGPPAATEDADAKAVRAWKKLTRGKRQRGNTGGKPMSEDGVSWMRGGPFAARDSRLETDVSIISDSGDESVGRLRRKKPVSNPRSLLDC
jgi:hypothetical protein